MASYDLTGTVKLVMDEVTFDSGFNKREFVVTTEGDRYPQDIKFECVKDRTAMLKDIKEGQRITVSFDVRGNEYKGRYYVNLTAWKVEPADEASGSGGAPSHEGDDERPPLDQMQEPADADGGDDIPF